MPPVCELEARCSEPIMGDDAPAQIMADHPCQGDGVALNHEVDVHPVRNADQRIAHRTTDKRHQRSAVREHEAPQQRISRHPFAHRASIKPVTDHVSGNLAASAPIALDGLTDAIARWEGSSLDELRAASERIMNEFRVWIEDPANSGRPISDAPVYLDRMAVEVLIERRYFSE